MAKAIEYASAGGQGGTLAAPSRSDLRMFRQAINGGYNLTPEMRAEIVAVAREILNSPPSIGKDGAVSNRDQIAAAKVLLAADKMDLDALKVAVDESKQPGASSITNNTQINNQVDLSGLSIEQLKALAGSHDGNTDT
jgi:hypothetical protein